jgi:hypothetical protein
MFFLKHWAFPKIKHHLALCQLLYYLVTPTLKCRNAFLGLASHCQKLFYFEKLISTKKYMAKIYLN